MFYYHIGSLVSVTDTSPVTLHLESGLFPDMTLSKNTSIATCFVVLTARDRSTCLFLLCRHSCTSSVETRGCKKRPQCR